jgi:hypothetical protein
VWWKLTGLAFLEAALIWWLTTAMTADVPTTIQIAVPATGVTVILIPFLAYWIYRRELHGRQREADRGMGPRLRLHQAIRRSVRVGMIICLMVILMILEENLSDVYAWSSVTLIAYYVGLVIFAALLHLPFYFPKTTHEDWWLGRILYAGFLYLCLGGWLFGWKLGLANIAVLFVIANLIVVPLDWIVHWLRPDARYRMPIRRETYRKMRGVAQKLGFKGINLRLLPVRNHFPEDDPPN